MKRLHCIPLIITAILFLISCGPATSFQVREHDQYAAGTGSYGYLFGNFKKNVREFSISMILAPVRLEIIDGSIPKGENVNIHFSLDTPLRVYGLLPGEYKIYRFSTFRQVGNRQYYSMIDNTSNHPLFKKTIKIEKGKCHYIGDFFVSTKVEDEKFVIEKYVNNFKETSEQFKNSYKGYSMLPIVNLNLIQGSR